MTDRMNYIMSKIRDIAELYLDQPEGFESSEDTVKHFINELEIGIDKLKELVE